MRRNHIILTESEHLFAPPVYRLFDDTELLLTVATPSLTATHEKTVRFMPYPPDSGTIRTLFELPMT